MRGPTHLAAACRRAMSALTGGDEGLFLAARAMLMASRAPRIADSHAVGPR